VISEKVLIKVYNDTPFEASIFHLYCNCSSLTHVLISLCLTYQQASYLPPTQPPLALLITTLSPSALSSHPTPSLTNSSHLRSATLSTNPLSALK
jgi:hypothetical protein